MAEGPGTRALRGGGIGAALGALLCVAAPAQRALLERMSLEQKAGQVLMSWILSKEEGQQAARASLRRWIREVGLGGVVLSLGTAGEAQRLIRDLQASAAVPLLVAGDFETGVAFRLQDTTHLGSNMLVGATGLARLARAQGRVTAVEGGALGFHWAFAPVADVNVNPANPIINVRSYGEDPARVARMVAAFVRGVEAEGMLATAKHFPGHGDVATDSHLVMPTVPGDRARLERVELAPFRAAIEAGVDSIMTGHLAVPGLGEEADVPATLSPRILTGVLRDELGFEGIVVTDALGMGGVEKAFPPEEVAVRALLAGADLLLMPPDPPEARDAIARAVRSGRLPESRLDEAVGRLLEAKRRAGLLDGRGVAEAAWQEVVGAPGHARVAAEIAARGLTLVRDARDLVPLRRPGSRVLVSFLDRAGASRGRTFRARLDPEEEVVWHRLEPGSSPRAVDAAARAVAAADVAIAALHVKVRSWSGRIGLPETFAPVVAALREAERAVAVSFGNPYLIASFPEVPAYLCAYNEGPFTERAAADALLGRAPITGRLPVSIPGAAPLGHGLTVLPGRDLGRAAPADEGLDPGLPARIEALLREAIEQRAFPGAVALVARRGRVVAHVAAGRETYEEDAEPIATDSLFDLASLTKVCATGPAVLRLVSRGELSLDTPVRELVPAFRGVGKERVTVRHLMAHASGLPSYVRYFRTLEGKGAIVEAAAGEGLVTEPGARTIYSDVGLILLMACVEKVAGAPFDRVARQEVFEPLGMDGARFARTGEPIDAVPTEVCAWRGKLVRGEVHDENAWAMGGVSGHAGLFATAEDVARLGVAYLAGGRGWLPRALVERAVAPAGLVEESSRALCWDTFRPGGSGGSRLSPRAFGHTGFTGTSVWCDPRTDLCIVLLTNRVHPTRVNGRIGRVRARFADLVAASLEEE